MNTVQVILLSVAMALDSLAIMTIEGAMLPRIKFKEVLKVSIIFGGWQALILILGNVLMNGVLDGVTAVNYYGTYRIFAVLAVIILLGLGIMKLRNGLRRHDVEEKRRNHFNYQRLTGLTLITSIDSFLVGMALSFINESVTPIILLIVLISIMSVILGIYIGYWLGYEEKSKAYTISGTIFVVASLNIMFKMI